MNFSTIVSLIALVVSVLSALASILSARYARHAARAGRDQADASSDQAEAAKQQLILERDRRNDELAQKPREDQAAIRANMHVLIRNHPQVPRIKVENHGPHEATEVTLTYLDADDGLPPPDTTEWHRLTTTLAAGEHSSVAAGFTANSTMVFRVTLRWKDAAGSQSKEVQLQRK